jgi:hypothetical protein
MIQDGSRKRPATSIVVRESFFIFAQLLNAPIQINRGAVLKSCESMMGRLFGQFGLFHRAASVPRRVQDDVRDTTINQIRH